MVSRQQQRLSKARAAALNGTARLGWGSMSSGGTGGRRFFGGGFGFGGREEEEEEQTPRGNDVRVHLELSLRELYLGASLRVRRPALPGGLISAQPGSASSRAATAGAGAATAGAATAAAAAAAAAAATDIGPPF